MTGPDQGPELAQIEIGYDHFVRDCPNSREERELEQLQHMLNMEEQDHRSLSMQSSDEDCRSPLNL